MVVRRRMGDQSTAPDSRLLVKVVLMDALHMDH